VCVERTKIFITSIYRTAGTDFFFVAKSDVKVIGALNRAPHPLNHYYQSAPTARRKQKGSSIQIFYFHYLQHFQTLNQFTHPGIEFSFRNK